MTVIEAPRVEIVGPDRTADATPTRFRARLSGEGDLAGARFDWDFGDGATATGQEVAHAFAEPGVHTVTLRAVFPGATEGCGTIETRRLVTVNAPPEPVIAAPDRVAAGALVLLDGSGSSDPDGAITGFAWDFGDGAHRHRRAGAAPLRRSPAPTGSRSPPPTTPASPTAASPPPAPSPSPRRRSPTSSRRRRSAPASRTPGPSPRTPRT